MATRGWWQGYLLSSFVLLCFEVRNSTLNYINMKSLLIKLLRFYTNAGRFMCMYTMAQHDSLTRKLEIDIQFQVCLVKYLKLKRINIYDLFQKNIMLNLL